MSKKHFRPGGMAASEWMRSVRGLGDTPGVDYSVPGVNTTRRVAYGPPRVVSLFVLALSASYNKRTLSHFGQLWPYIGIGSLGPPLIRDCNAMGDAAKISPHISSTCAQNAILTLLIIHIISSRQICVAIDDPLLTPFISCPTAWTYLWNYVHAADNVWQAENLQCNGCQSYSHLYIFPDGIQDAWVFRYCG